MKKYALYFICSFIGLMKFAIAQNIEVDQELLNYYKEEGQKEAAEMVREYYSMNKPRFQEAYNDYLNDLIEIAKTGRAPDNELLYNDLRLMKSEEEFVYSDSEEKYHR